MTNNIKYSLSFTAASFRLFDFLRVANNLQDYEGNIDLKQINAEVILSKGNQKTSKREMTEFLKRYNSLTSPQRIMLIEGSLDDQKVLTLLAIVKSNAFIRDFILEVVRDKFLLYDFQISDVDFKSFLNRKAELHPELDSFAVGTISKARQTLFKILADSGIIDSSKSKIIVKSWLSPESINIILADNPELLKVFLFSDLEIQQELRK
jgi:hypothetical protein